MFALITCPTCRHKFTVPEGVMGKRHICPNCRSPFMAGASVAELQAAPESAYNKTLLGTTEPPIHYNCPRCKKPLEAPASEAGVKKPCPSCGQRLQVPGVSPPASAQPSLNKTMLADEGSSVASAVAVMPRAAVADQAINKTMLAQTEPPEPPITFNCPRCKKPLESPASEAGVKKPCPSCGQRLQVPHHSRNKAVLALDGSPSATAIQHASAGHQASAAGGHGAACGHTALTSEQSRGPQLWPLKLSKRTYMIAGIVAASILLLFFLAALFAPNRDREALVAAQKELARLQEEIQQNKQKYALLEQQKRHEAEMQANIEQQKLREALMQKQIERQEQALAEQQRRLDAQRGLDLLLQDQKLANEAREKRRLEQEALDRQKAEQLALQKQFELDQLRRQEQQQQFAQEQQRRLEQERLLAQQREQADRALLLQQTIINSQPRYPWYHPWHFGPW